jgi:hypothetical protein
MTVKTLAGIEVREALLATRRQGSTELRERVRKLGKQRLGEGKPLVLLDALLREAEVATRDRNSSVHDPLAIDDANQWVATGDDAEPKAPPTANELNRLADRIASVGQRLNHARLYGFLHEALEACSHADHPARTGL